MNTYAILEKTTANKQDKKTRRSVFLFWCRRYMIVGWKMLKDKKNAKEMLDALESLFVRKTASNQLLLRKQLLTMKYDDAEDVNDHLLNFDTIRYNP